MPPIPYITNAPTKRMSAPGPRMLLHTGLFITLLMVSLGCTGERYQSADTGVTPPAQRDAGGGTTPIAPPGTGDPCTVDRDCENGRVCDGVWYCDGEFGCQQREEPIVCDDGILCTVDECTEPSGQCESRQDDSRCDDADPCTLNLCEITGCEFPNAPNGTPCPDGLCYQGACCPGCWDGLSCQTGDTLELCGTGGVMCENCDDGNPCTEDRCGEAGCVHEPVVDGMDCGTGICSRGECCEGCIAIDGSCRPGTELFACGREGALCTPCACASDTCDSGACPPGIFQVREVQAGRGHTCSLGETGRLYCWGSNQSRRALLDPALTGPTILTPTQASMTSDWTSISIDESHGCGIRTTGAESRLYCWGAGSAGQLGHGSTDSNMPPTEVSGSRVDWAQVSVGSAHTCAVTIGGLLFCWGSDTLGQLGIEGRSGFTSPEQVERGLPTAIGWQQVSTSRQHTCAIRRPGVGPERELWCWGSHSDGQLGVGDVFSSIFETPQRLADNDWESVSTGSAHSCAIRQDGTLWCWGDPRYGRLGVVGTSSATAPVQVGLDSDWRQVSAGTLHTCATKTDGTIWCWGRADTFALGLGAGIGAAVTTPMRVGVEHSWVSVDAGYSHTCGVRSDYTVYCWGTGSNAQLGVGDLLDRATPIRVCY